MSAQENLDNTFPNGIPFAVKFAIDDAINEAKTEVFNLYLAELKRIKPIFTEQPTKTVITQLIYFTYNNKTRHLSTFPKKKEHNKNLIQ